MTATQLFYLIPTAFAAAAVIGGVKLIYTVLTAGYAYGTRTLMHFSTAIFIGYLIVVWGWGIA